MATSPDAAASILLRAQILSTRLVKSLLALDGRRSLRNRLRMRHMQPLKRMIEDANCAQGSVRAIDIGGTPRH